MRYIIECVWRGYKGQLVPCHRTIIKNKRMAEELKKVNTIFFNDRTSMSVSVREALPREKIESINGYTKLFWEIFRKGLAAPTIFVDNI